MSMNPLGHQRSLPRRDDRFMSPQDQEREAAKGCLFVTLGFLALLVMIIWYINGGSL